MNKFFFGLITLLFFMAACNGQPNPKVWTKSYEQSLFNYLDSISKPSMHDNEKRTKYVEFIITRLKQEIPNGLKSVSRDSLHTLNIKIGREYASIHAGEDNLAITPYYEKWTPLIEKTFRDDYTALFQQKYPNKFNKFCDCMINKLKAIYPDSILVPIPTDINLKVTTECKKALEGN